MISYKSVVLDASKDQFDNLMVHSNPENREDHLKFNSMAYSQNPGGGDRLQDIIWNKNREDHQKWFNSISQKLSGGDKSGEHIWNKQREDDQK